GESQRSLAMGILDGGRGLVAAVASALLVLLVNLRQDVSLIFAATSLLTLLTAVGVWFSLRDLAVPASDAKRWDWNKAFHVLRRKDVWLLSAVVFTAYCGYKSIDNFGI